MSYSSTDDVRALAAYVLSAATGNRTLVAIDGRGCSGKSTLATQLTESLGHQAAMIGVDDFFVPFADQAPSAPGVLRHLRWGEFTEAIAQFKQGHGLQYRPYDWNADRLLPRETIDAPLLIVEGLYAMHRDVSDLYDVRIWVEADLTTRWDRVLRRDGSFWGDGPLWSDRWRNEFIPLEQRYIGEQRPWRRADIIVAGIGLDASDLGRALGER